MRFAVLAFAAVYLAGLADAQKQSLPQCSLECLNDLLPKSACAPTNQTCICTDADFQEQLETCVSENCTIKESLTTLNVTNTGCGAPIRDQTSPSIIIPAVGLGVLLFVGLRIYTRVVVTEANLGLDDWATILLGCCIVPVNVGSILLGKAGLGKDIWTLEFGSITRILYLYYIQELLYIFCVSLTKICFLLFYLRIFPSAQTRKVITISGIITICYCIAFMIALAFQCFPISYNWNAWDGEHTGKCVKKNTLVIAAAGLNIVLDAWVIALPIPRILNLQASISTKLQVVIMFSVGFLITGVSIYRTIMLKIFATSTNATWDTAAGGYWSIIEVDVGVFCLCMPAIRSLLGRMIPSVFGSTKDTNEGNSASQQKPLKVVKTTSLTQLIEMDNMGVERRQDNT